MTKMVVKSAFVFSSDISKLYTKRNNSLISFTMTDNNGRMVGDLNLGKRSFSVEHVMRMLYHSITQYRVHVLLVKTVTYLSSKRKELFILLTLACS